jgi:hypothetical protein
MTDLIMLRPEVKTTTYVCEQGRENQKPDAYLLAFKLNIASDMYEYTTQAE